MTLNPRHSIFNALSVRTRLPSCLATHVRSLRPMPGYTRFVMTIVSYLRCHRLVVRIWRTVSLPIRGFEYFFSDFQKRIDDALYPFWPGSGHAASPENEMSASYPK